MAERAWEGGAHLQYIHHPALHTNTLLKVGLKN